jgi:hypothetical protein
MAAVFEPEAENADDVDMERLVADAEYRRRVIHRLRRERLDAAAHRPRAAEEFISALGDGGSGEED